MIRWLAMRSERKYVGGFFVCGGFCFKPIDITQSGRGGDVLWEVGSLHAYACETKEMATSCALSR